MDIFIIKQIRSNNSLFVSYTNMISYDIIRSCDTKYTPYLGCDHNRMTISVKNTSIY